MLYNFKSIHAVPTSSDFIDIVLSRTQRKTPTVVHKRYQISRIREFYMRKIKFAQQTFVDRIVQIIEDFPKLDNIHPFYADLINVLYDRDHYKLALGQINVARNLIDNVGKDYIKLMKFGDSLYRCKLLKRAALGRMCTVIKKQSASFAYLEQVRQHLSRLPSIDPSTRTLLLTGYPNAGKSSFINKITRADVDVQPYAFTTKSLFVGHMDYKYLRWQVIDTPGILDHPLEERNTIEMQAVTALAHLNCAVLFFIDISGQGNYSIEQQVSLFKNIQPLFAKKPVIIVTSKVDVRTVDQLNPDEQALLKEISSDKGYPLVPLSNVTEIGIHDARSSACDLLLEQRVQVKLNNKKVDSILNRINVVVPKPRDGKVRDATIPESVLIAKAEKKERQAKLKELQEAGEDIEQYESMFQKRKTQKQVEEENGGAGVYSFNMRDHWDLENDEWKYDQIPEVFLGKNVLDFYDPDIESRLDALEKEEAQIIAEIQAQKDNEDGESDSELDEEHIELIRKIREKKKLMSVESKLKKTHNKPIMPRTGRSRSTQTIKDHMSGLGVEMPEQDVSMEVGDDETDQSTRTRGRSRSRKSLIGKKRAADETGMDIDSDEGNEEVEQSLVSRARSAAALARSQSQSRVRSESSFRDAEQKKEAIKIQRKKQKLMNRMGRAGEADRHIHVAMPKHLFSGKRGIGKTDRR